MSKMFDQASELEESHRAAAILAASQGAPAPLRPSGDGTCLWCGDPAPSLEDRWCSEDCAHDHQAELAIRARQVR